MLALLLGEVLDRRLDLELEGAFIRANHPTQLDGLILVGEDALLVGLLRELPVECVVTHLGVVFAFTACASPIEAQRTTLFDGGGADEIDGLPDVFAFALEYLVAFAFEEQVLERSTLGTDLRVELHALDVANDLGLALGRLAVLAFVVTDLGDAGGVRVARALASERLGGSGAAAVLAAAPELGQVGPREPDRDRDDNPAKDSASFHDGLGSTSGGGRLWNRARSRPFRRGQAGWRRVEAPRVEWMALAQSNDGQP